MDYTCITRSPRRELNNRGICGVQYVTRYYRSPVNETNIVNPPLRLEDEMAR
jgi:hypothetical protein